MNKILIQGRLTRDIEIESGKNGTEYAHFSVAVDRRGKKGEDKQTDFFNCAAFGQTAAFIKQYFHKGDGILIEGSMQSSQYDKDGEKRQSWSLIVSNVEFPLQKKGSSGSFQPLPDDEGGELPF